VLGLLRRFHAGGQTVMVVTHNPRVATIAAVAGAVPALLAQRVPTSQALAAE
jgi:ABC-type lipoprotein export system ATPase subunit